MLPLYSVEVPGAPTIPGEGKPRRNALLPDRLIEHPPDITTLYENFLHGVHVSENGNFLGHRPIVDGVAQPYVWETYLQVKIRVGNVGSGLRKLGLEPSKPLGVCMINCPEWTIAELASYQYNFVTVPLYDTFGTKAITHIINQTEMEYVLTTSSKVGVLLSLKESLPTLKTIIVIDKVNEKTIIHAKNLNVRLLEFHKIEIEGAIEPVEAINPKPEDIATICYTSGTTGTPKGAVLTHQNFMALVASLSYMGQKGKMYQFDKDDVHISYLPQAHVFERCNQAFVINGGAQIGFYQGDALKLLDDIAELKPTLFISVPRLFNRIYHKVLASVKAKGQTAEWVFNTAYNQKKASLAQGIVTHWFWDPIVFAPIRAKLGGRIKFMLSASAPISPDVVDFFKICFSIQMYEGLGQTENAGAITISTSDDPIVGHVGVPQLCGEVKLVDVPDMEYTSQDKPYPRGEICVRGHAVLREYYKLPSETEKVIDKDGWCHTGDIGSWDAQGRLIIIDRLKNIFKLAQGEYIAPEKIENVYQKHELINQAYVHGDSLQPSLVGIIVPDPDLLSRWAVQNNLGETSYEELCKTPNVRQHILQTLIEFGKANDLKGFENVKRVYLFNEPFSVQNDLLTPTFKLKRHQANNYFKTQIEEMYAELKVDSQY